MEHRNTARVSAQNLSSPDPPHKRLGLAPQTSGAYSIIIVMFACVSVLPMGIRQLTVPKIMLPKSLDCDSAR